LLEFSRVEQALLMQQRLTEVNHPNHLFIVYPDLGHSFAPSNQWIDSHGQMEEYVFQDMFEWLTSPAREVNEKILG
jgi:dipeptidyl aminopeptidase/acylaminoacyl peptidase